MSYDVLARKWRPQRFSEMVGQEHVLRALSNGLDSQRLHHAFLFTGTRGVGKTTIARILAKSLNCEEGISSKPCGECPTCKEIEQGHFIDLIEVDAASRTKVEDTRDLLDNVQYAPSKGRYKVYLIDEVHMLSNHSFNALLKTLEEPPPHVKFLLATTDPQKLPVTILSRCLQFNLKRLLPDMIETYLVKVLEAEKINCETTALYHLARAADGSMRDALSLLDQAIAFGAGQVNEADVKEMLGSIEHTHLFYLIEAIAKRDAEATLAKLNEILVDAPEHTKILIELLDVLHTVALLQQAPDAYDDKMGDRDILMGLVQSVAKEDIQLFYQIGLHGRRDLPFAPDPSVGLQMTILRMLAFAPEEGSNLQATNQSKLNTASEKPGAVSSVKSASALASTQNVQTQQKNYSEHTVAPVAATSISEPIPAASTSTSAPIEKQVPQAATPAPVTKAKSAAPIAGDAWSEMVPQLGLTGMLNQFAMNCALVMKDDNGLMLSLDPAFENLLTSDREKDLEASIGTFLGRPITLSINIKEAEVESPAELSKRYAQEKLENAQEAIEGDKNVQKIMETFGAEINPKSIQSLK